MTAIDGVNQVILNLNGHLHLRCLHILADHLDATLNTLILILEVLQPVGSKLLQGSHVLLWQCEHSLGLEWDGVTHVATLPAGQTSLALLDSLANQTNQKFICISTTLVNLQSRVSTTQALYSYLYCSIVGLGLYLLIVESSSYIDTTSATYNELSPVL